MKTKQDYIKLGQDDLKGVEIGNSYSKARLASYENSTSWQARAYMSGYNGDAPVGEVEAVLDAPTPAPPASTEVAPLEAPQVKAKTQIEVMRTALERTQKLFDEALPKFNWAASFLDANAIRLLNEVPGEVRAALEFAPEVPSQVVVPDLDIDAFMLKRFGSKVSPSGRLERRIVANLCAHMERHGWAVQGVHDGDDFHEAKTVKDAMELIFDLDDAGLYFERDGQEHRVLLVLGNGTDIISDWHYSNGDSDGFDAAMEAFDAEAYA